MVIAERLTVGRVTAQHRLGTGRTHGMASTDRMSPRAPAPDVAELLRSAVVQEYVR
jgi:hypothetical protein